MINLFNYFKNKKIKKEALKLFNDVEYRVNNYLYIDFILWVNLNSFIHKHIPVEKMKEWFKDYPDVHSNYPDLLSLLKEINKRNKICSKSRLPPEGYTYNYIVSGDEFFCTEDNRLIDVTDGYFAMCFSCNILIETVDSETDENTREYHYNKNKDLFKVPISMSLFLLDRFINEL